MIKILQDSQQRKQSSKLSSSTFPCKARAAGYTAKISPAAGYGGGSNLNSPDSQGQYWSSTPQSGNTMGALDLYLNSDGFGRGQYIRYNGQSVRPVRGSAP